MSPPFNRALAACLGAASVFAVVAGCAHCGGDDTAATDASVSDAGRRDVRRDQEADAALPEAEPFDAPTSDWPGWKRIPDLAGFDCALDVAVDPSTVVPTIKWIPCTDGRANCEEIEGTAFSPEIIKFPNGWFSRDGRAFLLSHFVKRGSTADIIQMDVFDTKTLAPLAAWRYRADSGTYCGVHPEFTQTKMGALYSTSVDAGPIVSYLDYDTPAGLMATPSLSLLPLLDDSSDFRISDQAFAFGTNLSTSIFRGVTATKTELRTNWPYQLIQPQVVGNDVYANIQHGMGDGWYGEARIESDAGVSIIRAVPQRHVTAMTTDGNDWYWAESYGSSNPDDDPQPKVEIYTGAYTNNPVTLDNAKKKIVTMPPGSFIPGTGNAVASPGHYIFQSIAGQTEIARASDGHHTSVVNQGTAFCWISLYASDTEFWCIERLGKNGPDGVKVTKIHLLSW